MNTYIDTSKLNIKAFSLVELMVVIAIVATLAAISVPSYRDYVSKAKMVEIYNLTQNQMDYVVEKYSLGTTTARTLTGTGVTGIVATPSGTGGTVAITFTATSNPISSLYNNATATVVTYTLSETNGILSWGCVISGNADAAARTLIKNAFYTNCA